MLQILAGPHSVKSIGKSSMATSTLTMRSPALTSTLLPARGPSGADLLLHAGHCDLSRGRTFEFWLVAFWGREHMSQIDGSGEGRVCLEFNQFECFPSSGLDHCLFKVGSSCGCEQQPQSFCLQNQGRTAGDLQHCAMQSPREVQGFSVKFDAVPPSHPLTFSLNVSEMAALRNRRGMARFSNALALFLTSFVLG